MFIPQVVLLVYEKDAVSLLRAQLKAADGTVLYDSINSSQWTAMKTQIKNHVAGFYTDAGANVRIVDSSAGLASPYTVVRLVKGSGFPVNTWGYGGGCDFHDLRPNAEPADDMAKVLVVGHRWIINDAYQNSVPLPTLPLGPDNLSWSIAITVCHELAHSLGLVYNNTILGGTPYPLCHNPGTPPTGWQWHLMTGGSPTKEHLDPASNWCWKEVNTDYLKFILPKE